MSISTPIIKGVATSIRLARATIMVGYRSYIEVPRSMPPLYRLLCYNLKKLSVWISASLRLLLLNLFATIDFFYFFHLLFN